MSEKASFYNAEHANSKKSEEAETALQEEYGLVNRENREDCVGESEEYW